jgi:hypothetical protein
MPDQQGKRIVRVWPGGSFGSARGGGTRFGHRFGEPERCKPIATRGQSALKPAIRFVYNDLPATLHIGDDPSGPSPVPLFAGLVHKSLAAE